MNVSSQNLHVATTGRLRPMAEAGNSRFMYNQYGASGTEEALLRQPPSPSSPPSASAYAEQLSPPQPMFFGLHADEGAGEGGTGAAPPSPPLSTFTPYGLLDPNLGVRRGVVRGMESAGTLSLRDDVDYSRPVAAVRSSPPPRLLSWTDV